MTNIYPNLNKWSRVSGSSDSMSMWLVPALIIIAFTFLALILNVHAQDKVDAIYFTLTAPSTWAYTQDAKSPIKDLLGIGSYYSVVLVPSQFGTYLIDEEEFDLENGSAAVMFSKDSDYSVKNAPLDLYVKYRTDKDEFMNMTSRQNTMVGNEKAVKIEGIGLDDYKNIKFEDYLMLHANDPYQIRYMANAKNFNNYLPQFEQMVKSFEFKD
jgi:hypothetical protein